MARTQKFEKNKYKIIGTYMHTSQEIRKCVCVCVFFLFFCLILDIDSHDESPPKGQ